MMLRRVFLVIYILFSIVSYSQKTNSALKVGDKLPANLFLGNILNYKSEKIKLSDLKGKAIIFDFWNKYCASCIAAFPKMEKLKREFNDKIEIFLVTNNIMDELSDLFKRSVILRNTSLPFIIGDTLLHQLFPHPGVPFHVWIDAKQKIQGFALAQSDATVENVNAIISGQPLRIVNMDNDSGFTRDSKPLVLEGNGRQWKHLEYYSTIMRGIVGFNGFQESLMEHPVDGSRIWNSIKILNCSPLHLFKYAYGDWPAIIVEGKHAEDFYMPVEESEIDIWRDTMAFSYECVLPSSCSREKIRSYLRQDIERYFGVSSNIEQRLIKCYIIYRTSNRDLFETKGENKIQEHTKSGWIFKNASGGMKNIISIAGYGLSGTKSQPIIIDETGFDKQKRVDFEIKAYNIIQLELLQKELAKYDLNIKQELRTIPCLVIRDL